MKYIVYRVLGTRHYKNRNSCHKISKSCQKENIKNFLAQIKHELYFLHHCAKFCKSDYYRKWYLHKLYEKDLDTLKTSQAKKYKFILYIYNILKL